MANKARKFRVKRIAANEVHADNIFVKGNTLAGGLALGSAGLVDLNGAADALVLDLDGDTTISAPTDDQIDFEIKSVDHVVMKAVATPDAGTTNLVEIAATTPIDTGGTNIHNALNIDLEIGDSSGGTNAVRAIAIDDITGDAQVIETGLLLGTGFDIGIDMQGTKIDLDADGDTSITADTDNEIDIEIAGAVDFTFLANILRAIAGSVIETNTINETTGASGVTIDSVLVKDGGIVCADAATLEVDTVNEATAAAGVTADGVLLKDGGIVCADAATLEVDTVNEATSAAGVTIDSVLVKDGAVTARQPVIAVTSDGAISVPNGNTTYYCTKAGVAAMTLVDPTATTHDGLRLTFIATTANANTLDLVTSINGGAADIGTFGGASGDGTVIEAYQGTWYEVPGNNANVTWA